MGAGLSMQCANAYHSLAPIPAAGPNSAVTPENHEGTEHSCHCPLGQPATQASGAPKSHWLLLVRPRPYEKMGDHPDQTCQRGSAMQE